jgi:hypothetical protein
MLLAGARAMRKDENAVGVTVSGIGSRSKVVE